MVINIKGVKTLKLFKWFKKRSEPKETYECPLCDPHQRKIYTTTKIELYYKHLRRHHKTTIGILNKLKDDWLKWINKQS